MDKSELVKRARAYHISHNAPCVTEKLIHALADQLEQKDKEIKVSYESGVNDAAKLVEDFSADAETIRQQLLGK